MRQQHFSYYIDLKYICQFVCVGVCVYLSFIDGQTGRPTATKLGMEDQLDPESVIGGSRSTSEVKKTLFFVQQRGHSLLVII